MDPQQDWVTYYTSARERGEEDRKGRRTSCIAFANGLLALARDLSTYSFPATW